MVLIMT